MTDYGKAFYDYLVSKGVSKNTLDSYQRDVEHYLAFLKEHGNPLPEKSDKKILNQYIEELQSLGRSPSTVTRNMASIRSFYQYLIQLGLAEENPAKQIKIQKKEKKLPQILTQQEVELLLRQP